MKLPGRDFLRPLNAISAPGTLPEIDRQGYRPTTHCALRLCKPTAATGCKDLGPTTGGVVIAVASTLARKIGPHCALLMCMFVVSSVGLWPSLSLTMQLQGARIFSGTGALAGAGE